MDRIGAYEAKTRLPELLRRVAGGETITITRHGIPVALLKPVEGAPKRSPREVTDELRSFRGEHRLDGLTLRELIEEGRR
ncbi:MAG TPA: type II toxin-antitoxin system prevent-host-death family antitoxin [Verrucomicrobia bacterium]|nr:type II toxin-antitoxin system prevent-host-death family antitoxin [Verrucomicrobiota bacterium]